MGNLGSSAELAYTNIRQRILTGELVPGAVLSEASLAKQLGISRTPVGEALRELSGEGLVQQVPRFGTIVRSFERRDIIELYEVREALEAHAVALGAQRVSPADLERLERLCQRMEQMRDDLASRGERKLDTAALRECLAADMAFHMLLISSAGNRRMAEIVRDSHVISQVFGAQKLEHTPAVLANTCQQHRKILAAVARGDVAGARDAAAEHVRSSLARNLECLDRQGEPGGACDVALPPDVRAELSRAGMAPHPSQPEALR